MPQYSADPWAWLTKGLQGYVGMLRTSQAECPEALNEPDYRLLRKWHAELGKLLDEFKDKFGE